MGVYKLRCNLASGHYPFVSTNVGRTVVQGQYDQNYDRTVMSQEPYKVDKGIPFVHYMENVLPTIGGYISAQSTANLIFHSGFPNPQAGGAYIQPDIFDCLELTYNHNGTFVVYLFFTSAGVYLYTPGTNAGLAGNYTGASPMQFQTAFPPTALSGGQLVTHAHVQGTSYIFISGIGCYTYDFTLNAMRVVQLASLNTSLVLGICSSNGYMLTWTATQVAWSSTTVPTDFTPSTTTGASSGTLQQAKGNIKFCLPIAGGFIVYCENNVVAATFQQNILWPFIFAEVGGSGGVKSIKHVAYKSNMPDHYAWTTFGLQTINRTGAQQVLTDVTDFIQRRIYEQFSVNDLSGSFPYWYSSDISGAAAVQKQFTFNWKAGLIRHKLKFPFTIRVDILLGRYVAVSYGISPDEVIPLIITNNTAKDPINPNNNAYASSIATTSLAGSGSSSPFLATESHGVPVYHNCIMYDLALKRYGVLKPVVSGFTLVADFYTMFSAQGPITSDKLGASGFPDKIGASVVDNQSTVTATSSNCGELTANDTFYNYNLSNRNKSNIYFIPTVSTPKLSIGVESWLCYMLTPGSDAVQDTGAGQFYTDYSTSPVLILGKFQFARDRLATHQLTEIEGGQSDKWATQNPFKNSALTPFTTDSGIKVGMLLERLGTYLQPPTVTFSWMRCNSIINSSADYGQGGLYTQWANMQCGLNYSVVILGNFENLASVVTSMTSEGKR